MSAADAAKTPAKSASPAQIADAMIRSMLGSPAPGDPQSGDPTSSDPKSSNVANMSAPGAPTLNQTASAPEMTPIAVLAMDILGSPSAGDGASGNKAAPGTPGANQTPGSKKQLLVATDAPTGADGTTILVIAPQPAPSAPDPAMPAPSDSRSNQAGQGNPAGSASPAAASITLLAKGSPESQSAFTAILTPTNETPAASAAPDAAKQVSTVPEPATSSLVAAPVASPEPASSASSLSSQPPLSSQPTGAQGVESQTAIQAAGAKSGGDTPSQQQGDSPETPAPLIAIDTKNKAAIKHDDNDPQAVVTAGIGALQDHLSAVTPLADQARTATTTQSSAAPAAETPSQATAEALRTSESNLAATPQSRTGAAQEITIRIERPDASPVDLRVVERAGQLHVDVRTPDGAMQTSLRADLGTLTNSLQRAGYHTETFTPSTTLGRTASSAQTSNQDDHQDSSQNRGGSGSFSGDRRQQQQQKRSGTWLEELENQS
jgi:Flagellar hook-length control protein FliK